MKTGKNILALALSVLFLAAAAFAPGQTPAVSLGVLPFQDESGGQVPAELLGKLTQDFCQKMNLSYQDVLARVLTGGSEAAGTGVEQLAALGQQQGIRFIMRGGILALSSEKAGAVLSCRAGLYAELVDCRSGASSIVRANADGADENAAFDDVRRWEAYDFQDNAFSRTALGGALASAVDQLIPQVYQAIQSPAQAAEETVQETVPEDQASEFQAADQDAASYESDQELEQLIAQAESLMSSGAASGLDITALQEATEALRNALNEKLSRMEQGRDTSAADDEVTRRRDDLRAIVDAFAQAASAEQPSEDYQPVSGEKQDIIQKVGGLLDETLSAIQKIQEIRSALRGAEESEEYGGAETAEESTVPVEESTTDVSGVVVDEYGNPVEDVLVTDPQSGAEATTDSTGSYMIPMIPGGRIADIHLMKNGRRLFSGKIQLLKDRSAFADWKIRILGGGGPGPTAAKILPSTIILPKKKGIQASRLGTVTGLAVDAQGRPVARALVLVQGVGTARTDSRGGYAFYNVPEGSYRLVVKRGGATVQAVQVQVTGKKAVENRIIFAGKEGGRPAGVQTPLAKGSGTLLTGTVVNEEKKALSGAKITAILKGSGGLSVFTGKKGAYELRDLKPGSYRLLVNKAGFQEASQSVALLANRGEVRNFRLNKASAEIQKIISAKKARVAPRPAGKTPDGFLSGQILDSGNRKPIANATVQAEGKPAVRTDVNGRYRLGGLPPGQYHIVAGHPDFKPAEKSVTIRANRTTQENFSLKRRDIPKHDALPKTTASKTAISFGRVRGRVTDEKTGKPLVQTTVILSNKTTQTNASGEFGFANVPAGSYTVTFKKSGYQSAERRLSVAAGQTAAVNIRLIPVVRLRMKMK